MSIYPICLKIPHENEIIWTQRGVRAPPPPPPSHPTPRAPSGFATANEKEVKKTKIKINITPYTPIAPNIV